MCWGKKAPAVCVMKACAFLAVNVKKTAVANAWISNKFEKLKSNLQNPIDFFVIRHEFYQQNNLPGIFVLRKKCLA